MGPVFDAFRIVDWRYRLQTPFRLYMDRSHIHDYYYGYDRRFR